MITLQIHFTLNKIEIFALIFYRGRRSFRYEFNCLRLRFYCIISLNVDVHNAFRYMLILLYIPVEIVNGKEALKGNEIWTKGGGNLSQSDE